MTRNLSGGAWLLADLSLNIWALTIVKAWGLAIPAPQLVFLRALVGLALIAPWIWRDRAAFRGIGNGGIGNVRLHLLRVALSTTALTASFFAIARLPFALFSAISFTRPILMMIMAAVFLAERIPRSRRIAALVALVGVLIAVQPGALAFTWGLPAMALTVLSGTAAIIVTRRLKGTPTIVMMTFYTAGLALCIAPLAVWTWVPPGGAWPVLLGVGLFAQCAQFCFLQAHVRAEAGFLAVLGYLSLPLSTGIGWLVFGEVPGWAFAAGAALIVAAALSVTLTRR